jgi:hypothetical protein
MQGVGNREFEQDKYDEENELDSFSPSAHYLAHTGIEDKSGCATSSL